MHIFLALIIYVLVGSYHLNGKKYCQYADGSTIIVSPGSMCPPWVER